MIQQKVLVDGRQIESATRLFDRPRIAARLFGEPRHGAAQIFVFGQE
ncbi:MAG: hypothetical protein ABW205_13320 [Burkholderiales bacterium]